MTMETLLMFRALFFSAGLCTALTAGEPSLEAGRVDGPVRLDGRLDEPFWTACPEGTGFRPLANMPQLAIAQATRFRVAVSPDAVLIGVVCADDRPWQRGPALPRDHMGVFSRDVVELFLDPTGLGQSYYQLAITRQADRYDNFWFESGRTAKPWSGTWEAAAAEIREGWSVEVRLPLASLSLTGAEAMRSTWRANVTRTRPQGTYASWAPVVKGFHDPDWFGRFGGMPCRPAVDDVRVDAVSLEAYPGLTMRAVVELSSAAVAAGPLTVAVEIPGGVHGTARTRLEGGPTRLALDLAGTIGDGTCVEATVKADRDGRILATRIVSVKPARERLRIELTSPCAPGIAYPDERIEAVAGKVCCGGPLPEGAELALALQLPGRPAPIAVNLPAAGGVAFRLPVDGLPPGDGSLGVRLRVGEKVLAEGSAPIQSVGRPPVGPIVRVDRRGRLLIDGKPHLFLDLYSPWYMISSAIAKKLGGVPGWLNAQVPGTVSPLTHWGIEPDRLMRDLKDFDTGEITRDQRPSEAMLAAVRARVCESVAKGGAAFWYLADEPDYRSLSPVYLAHLYREIKAIDPWRPVMIATTSPAMFRDAVDMVSFHPYIGPAFGPDGVRRLGTPVREIRNETRQALNGGVRMAIGLPQAFAYHFTSLSADYPTEAEYQASLWIPIVSGANGLWPFLGSGMFDRPHLRHGTRFTFESLRALQGILLQDADPLALAIAQPGDSAIGLLRREGDALLLIVVNMDPQAVRVTLRAEALAGIGELKAFRAGRTVPVRDGAIALDLAPYQVVVAGRNLPEAGLPGEAAWRETQARDEEALHRPGNILYDLGRAVKLTGCGPGGAQDGDLDAQMKLFDGVRDANSLLLKGERTVTITLPRALPLRELRISGWKLRGLTIEADGRPAAVTPAPDEESLVAAIHEGDAVRVLRLVSKGRADGATIEVYELEGYR